MRRVHPTAATDETNERDGDLLTSPARCDLEHLVDTSIKRHRCALLEKCAGDQLAREPRLFVELRQLRGIERGSVSDGKKEGRGALLISRSGDITPPKVPPLLAREKYKHIAHTCCFAVAVTRSTLRRIER